MSGGVCRRQGIIHQPLAAFGHPSPHNHSGTGPTQSLEESTHTLIHTRLILSALCKLDGEKEYDNKQPYVRSTSNNIGGFLCCLIFPVVLRDAGYYGNVRVPGKKSPVNIATLFPCSPLLSVCVWGSGCVRVPGVCMLVRFEGCSCCRSTKPGPCVEMQPPG